MTKRIAFVFILVSMQILIGAQEPKPALKLTLSPDRVEVVSGGRFTLKLDVIKLTPEVVHCLDAYNSDGLDIGWKYDIRDSDGNPVPLTHPDADGLTVTGSGGCPDEFTTDFQNLMQAFEMKKPGVYTVRVSRSDLDHPARLLGTSNPVTVVVKAPE